MKFRTSKIIGVTVFESFQNWFHGKLSCKKILKFPHCAFDSIWCRWFTNDVYLSEKLNLDFCDAISDLSTWIPKLQVLKIVICTDTDTNLRESNMNLILYFTIFANLNLPKWKLSLFSRDFEWITVKFLCDFTWNP